MDSGRDAMKIIRVMAGRKGDIDDENYADVKPLNSLPLSIIYIILLGQLLTMVLTYYKRSFNIAFLITIFPIVAMYNIWQKVHVGKRKQFGTVDQNVYRASIYSVNTCDGLCYIN